MGVRFRVYQTCDSNLSEELKGKSDYSLKGTIGNNMVYSLGFNKNGQRLEFFGGYRLTDTA